MAELSFYLPAELHQRISNRAAHAGDMDTAAFLRDLIERDQAAYEADVQRVKALIEEGIASGIDDREPEQILDEILADLELRD